MKKGALVGLALVLTLMFVTSCGVSQEEYDRVSSDLTAAQTQIQSLQGDLSTKETQLSAKESELSANESELEAAKEKLRQGKARIEIFNAIFIPAMRGELDVMSEAESMACFLEWRDEVIAVGDPALTAEFEAIMETFSDEALLSFLVYLLESVADALD